MIICFTETQWKPVDSAVTHRNEFQTTYSLAGCSTVAHASPSLAVLILQRSAQPVQENPANGKCLNFPLSQIRAQPKLRRKCHELSQPTRREEAFMQIEPMCREFSYCGLRLGDPDE